MEQGGGRGNECRRETFFPCHSHAHSVFIVHLAPAQSRAGWRFFIPAAKPPADEPFAWEPFIFRMFRDSFRSLLPLCGARCGVRVGGHLFPAWAPFAQSPRFVSTVMNSRITGSRGGLDVGFGSDCFILSVSSLWGRTWWRKHTQSLLFVSCFFQNSELQPSVFPEWQSFSNATLYLACTAAYLAPVPSAICPDRCAAPQIPRLLCILLSSCPKLGGSKVEASVKLSQTNEDAHWSVVCVCAAVRWDCTVTLPWV